MSQQTTKINLCSVILALKWISVLFIVCAHVCVCVFCFQAVIYEVGFLVCAIIGVLYIILMPIVGLILACCRCCGNCGGKMFQKQTSSIGCRRRTLYWGLFITTIIILWVFQRHIVQRYRPWGTKGVSLTVAQGTSPCSTETKSSERTSNRASWNSTGP